MAYGLKKGDQVYRTNGDHAMIGFVVEVKNSGRATIRVHWGSRQYELLQESQLGVFSWENRADWERKCKNLTARLHTFREPYRARLIDQMEQGHALLRMAESRSDHPVGPVSIPNAWPGKNT